MTKNRRLFLNIIATNGRSLFTMLCAFLTARWSLMALGQEAYGLLGLVGGLVVFISFFNRVLHRSIIRFYAVAVGEAEVNSGNGLEECRKWFNTALLIHIIVPILLTIIGYPVGEWFVRNYLVIPNQYYDTCVWIFRFVCISSFVAMITVPYSAMYSAKQYIAELTIYSFVTTLVNVGVLHWMVTHEGEWLFWLALVYCLEQVVPQIIIALRALFIFPECRLVPRYMRDLCRVRQVFSLAWWQAFTAIAEIVRGQGVAILVNRFFGPKMNASFSVAGSLSGRCLTFSNEIQAAFAPAICNAYGSGDKTLVTNLSFRCDKICSLLMMIIGIPVCLESGFLLTLWLKTPPMYTESLCVCIFVQQMIDKMSVGEMEMIVASGRVRLLQLFSGLLMILVCPIVWVAFRQGGTVFAVVVINLLIGGVVALSRVLIARRVLGIAVLSWFRTVLFPLLLVSAVGVCVGFGVKCVLTESVLRLILLGFACVSVMILMSSVFVLTKEEKDFIRVRLQAKFTRIFKR